MDRMPSEVLKEVLDWVNECQTEYDTAKAIIAEEESKQQDFWHLLEFNDRCEDRSKISTVIHKSRLRRRHYKNEMELLEPLITFLRREQTKLLLKGFKTLIPTLERQEQRIAEPKKEYRPRSSVYAEICREIFGEDIADDGLSGTGVDSNAPEHQSDTEENS